MLNRKVRFSRPQRTGKKRISEKTTVHMGPLALESVLQRLLVSRFKKTALLVLLSREVVGL